MKASYLYKHNPIVRKIFLAMLAPTILMNLTTAIGSMADTVIIGQYLDDASLSVVTFATPVYMIINTLAALFAVGGCIVMSIESGKGNRTQANKAFSLSMEMLLFVGALLVLAGVFFIDPVTRWLGAEKGIFAQVRTYARIVLFGAPIFVLNIGLAFFVRNDGRPTLSMAGMLISIVVDIAFNLVFVGWMDMGVAGAAYSTVLGQLVSALIIASHFFSGKNTLKFLPALDTNLFRILKNGGSSALNFVYQFVTILIINHFLSDLAGLEGVVIYTVVFNLSTVSLSVFEGISQTIQPMVSTYYGEKSFCHIRETMRYALITVFAICGAATVVLEIFPQIVPKLFGIDDSNLILQSAQAVRIYAVCMVIATVNVVLSYYLQSTEHSVFSAVLVSLRSFVLFLGATVVLGLLFRMNGVWAAYAVADALTLGIALCFLWFRKRKHKGKYDLLLLEEEIKQGSHCLVLRCGKDDGKAYAETVCTLLSEAKEETAVAGVRAYLLLLQRVSRGESGKFVAFEWNSVTGKVILRDNLCHDSIRQEAEALAAESKDAEYGLVLGWNRICFS